MVLVGDSAMRFVLAVTFLLSASSVRADNANEARERSEEHTSELQSPCNLVCRLLLAKKTHNTRTTFRPISSLATSRPHSFNTSATSSPPTFAPITSRPRNAHRS